MEGYIEKMLAPFAPLAPNRVQRVQEVQPFFLFRLPICTYTRTRHYFRYKLRQFSGVDSSVSINLL